MADYNKLEQLNRLRESGALTQEEFDREKSTILTGNPGVFSRNRGIVIGALLLLAFIVLAALFGRSIINPRVQEEKQATSDLTLPTPNETAAVEIENISAPPAPAVATEPVVTLDWAFSDRVIGLNPAYLESKLGPPKTKSQTYWEFEIRGCAVGYAVNGNEIASASTMVSARCQPTVMGTKVTARSTFAQVSHGSEIIRAACIYSCGNAADPTMEMYQRGVHANQFIDVVYVSRLGAPQTKAMDLWVSAIRVAHGAGPDDYDADNYEWFQCLSNPPAPVVRALAPEKVGSVTIGRNLTKDGSCRYPS